MIEVDPRARSVFLVDDARRRRRPRRGSRERERHRESTVNGVRHLRKQFFLTRTHAPLDFIIRDFPRHDAVFVQRPLPITSPERNPLSKKISNRPIEVIDRFASTTDDSSLKHASR